MEKGFTYNIDMYRYLSAKEQAYIYMGLSIPDLTAEEKQELNSHQTYIRFMCYENPKTGKMQMFAYCRPISKMSDTHKQIAMLFLSEASILCELNSSRAHFFPWPLLT